MNFFLKVLNTIFDSLLILFTSDFGVDIIIFFISLIAFLILLRFAKC